MDDMRFNVNLDFIQGKTRFYGAIPRENGFTHLKPIEVETEVETIGSNYSPFMELDIEIAQRLMDAMYSAGLRPSKYFGGGGDIGATSKHLDDMRKIVSKQLDIDL